MSFQTGLSGLNASTQNLNVIGNNIANADTIGAKSSRVEFSAVIAAASGPSGSTDNGGGLGVQVSTISQQFTQGTINITGNNMDVAINGAGFFPIKQADGSTAYTRDGEFKLDSNGNIVTNNSAKVLGFPTDALGNATSTTLTPLAIPTGAPIPAKETANLAIQMNLNSSSQVATSTSPPPPITTYGTSINSYDALGNVVPTNLYFVKVGPDPSNVPPVTANLWNVYNTTSPISETNPTTGTTTTVDPVGTLQANAATGTTNTANTALDVTNRAYNIANAAAISAGTLTAKQTFNTGNAGDGTDANGNYLVNTAIPIDPISNGALFQIEFDSSGKIVTPSATAASSYTYPSQGPTPSTVPLTMTLTSPTTGTQFNVTLDLSKATQFGTAFAVSNLSQDGYTAGTLTGVSIGSSGVITTSYSNGQSQSNGQLALANFRNVQGLAPSANGTWVQTPGSGQPITGNPGQGNFGAVQSGALEASNVDLTAELVSLMTAQRNYQSNAQTIKTQDQALQTLVNMR